MARSRKSWDTPSFSRTPSAYAAFRSCHLARYAANAVKIRRLPVAHASHLLMDLCHFGLAKVRPLAQGDPMKTVRTSRQHSRPGGGLRRVMVPGAGEIFPESDRGTCESRCGATQIENTLVLFRHGWARMSDQVDECPYCRSGFEIVCVRFRLKSAVAIWHCPNCAVASTADGNSANRRSLDFAKKFALLAGRWWAGACRMEQAINSRVKYALAFLIAAILVAALLRHTVHVYGGFSRGEIRDATLIALPAAIVVFHLLRSRRR